MSTDFPYVTVPPALASVIGEPYLGTRMYRKEGAQEETQYWYEALNSRFGALVSVGGVSMFAPVSRAAVHKRMKEGKLTCFLFDITHRKRNLFGQSKSVRELEMVMIPVSECKAWGKEIEQRAIAQGIVTQSELEGDKPDWDGEFMNYGSREERQLSPKPKKKDKS